MIYSTIPSGLGVRARSALGRYAEETGVTLMTERRGAERRTSQERRSRARLGRFRAERRTIRNSAGRRVADRRATVVPVAPPLPLPRRLRAHSEHIEFAAPLSMSSEHIEDIHTARLIVRIQGGEGELFRALYEQWFDRVYTYARASLGRSMLAELATQDVFADLHTALPSYEIDCERFRAWFAVIVSRRIQAELVALRGPEALSTDESGQGAGEAPHAVPVWVNDADLQVLVSRLPLPERSVVLLRYLMALSQAEVAATVGRSVDAVADLHASGIAILAERQLAIGRPSEASSIRLAMARRRRPARVLQSRRLALLAS